MSFKAEFKLEKLKFKHDSIEDFYTLRCCGIPARVLWLIRLVFTLYTIASIIFSIAFYNDQKWIVFLTNWGLILSTVYFITALAVSGYYIFRNAPEPMTNSDIPMYTLEKDHQQNPSSGDLNEGRLLPFPIKFLWFWHHITYGIVTTLIILYWTLVRQPKHFSTGDLTFSYINDHGGIFLLLCIDFSFCLIPFRILHVIYTLVVCILYAVVTVIYNFATDDPVYEGVLDWQNKAGWGVIYILGAIVLLFILQLIYFGFYRLKLRLKND
ncbi:protein rolling stone-like isoform X2 [Clytia hemisphaerica]|uniref:Protein rolling stone n=1 Tax=Clytia hemisphaerica TaxID=252671 RepID=A0A7M5V2G9_9CNID